MTVEGAATGTALIHVDAAGHNQIGVAAGANHRFTVEMARAHEASLAWAEVLLADGGAAPGGRVGARDGAASRRDHRAEPRPPSSRCPTRCSPRWTT